MFTATFKDMTELHDEMCRKMQYGEADEFDYWGSMQVDLNNVMVMAESMAWDVLLTRTWVGQARWNTMVKQYLNPDELNRWLDQIESRTIAQNQKRGVYVLRTNTVKQRASGGGPTRSLGSCMLSLTFSLSPIPQVTLYSRTSYMGYLSLLDISVAHVAAKLIGARLGIPVESFRFKWILEQMQYHGYRTLAFPLGDADEAEVFWDWEKSKKYPSVYIARNHAEKFKAMDEQGLLYSGVPFNSYLRLRKRWHTEMFGFEYANQFSDFDARSCDKAYAPLPKVHAADLTFGPVGVLE
jgi:hypothetical protein